MKKGTMKKLVAILIAVICCITMAMPTFAANDAVAPLAGIALNDGMDANYSLAPAFNQNTQVYTITSLTDAGTMPTSAAEALAIVGYTAPDGTNSSTAYDPASQLLTITTDKGGASTLYYISFSDKSEQKGTTNIANIEVTKILQADADAKLDSLSFTYELFPIEIVENTAPAGTSVIPLATGENSGTEATGTVVVTSNDEKSTMVIDNWDGENVPLVSSNAGLAAAQAALENNKYVTGKYTLEFDTVGQYKYLLHEVTGDASGVTYDQNWYEITVSAVHADPNDPTSDVVIGWIEVKEVTTYTSNTEYEAGEKVNFGKTETIDNEKYDNLTTSITYPFINVLATEDLVVSKTVTGDLGNADQEFLFTIEINGKNLADSYDISYTENAVAPQLLPSTISTDGSTGTAYVTLKHNQTLTIADLPVGATYSIAEVDADDEHLTTAAEAANYNTTINYDDTLSDPDGDVVRNVIVGKAIDDHDIIDTKAEETNDMNFVGYVNDKPLTPPTAAFIDMIPYIAIVAVAVVGITVFAVVRKRRAADEI